MLTDEYVKILSHESRPLQMYPVFLLKNERAKTSLLAGGTAVFRKKNDFLF